MRKKTTPLDRKNNMASSCEKTGLIANNKTDRRSVGTKSVLDNRSHRTPWDSPAPREARCQQSLVRRRVTSVVVTAQGFAFKSHLCSGRVAQ
jgi:hypothetical protein